MQILNTTQKVPIYSLNPDKTGDKHFKVYHYEGGLPDQTDLLVPHRKSHYLLVFIRKADSRQWIDMTPYEVKNNTVYFSGPDNMIVKEGFSELWSTGIAFTPEFLSSQDNASLNNLPIIRNPYNGHELALTAPDILFIEEIISKIRLEYEQSGEWQQRMLAAYLTVLLTYLSRLYTEQYKGKDTSTERQLDRKSVV